MIFQKARRKEKMDLTKYKFRTSGLPTLMSNGRSKNGGLSETAKAYVQSCFISAYYGRALFVQTNPMRKGTMVESDILDLVNACTGELYFKNKDKFENDFIMGTPDIKSAEDRVIDAKASWMIWQFFAVDEDKAKKDYFWQICGYAWMLGKKKGELIYGLVNTPEELILNELYKSGINDKERERDFRKCHIYDDIEAEKRLKRYTFDFTDDDFKAIENRVIEAREYMKELAA